jgi:4-amino-4-deoxy-L-arabinose transferase-like glycosyltransferase
MLGSETSIRDGAGTPEAHRATAGKPLTVAVIISLILITATCLRLFGLEQQSLDGDELLSRRVVLSNWSVAVSAIEQNLVNPPLHYFVLKAILPLTGSGAMGIRALSLFAGVASIGVVILWGVALPKLKYPALLAAALLTLNTIHVFYSQQARMYALYCLFVSCLILWALVLDRYAERRAFWVIGALIITGAIYTHYVGALFALAVSASLVLGDTPKRYKLCIICTILAAAAACLPWFLIEIPVFKNRHGLSSSVGWQGIPIWYDLQAIWARYVGVPDVRGGTSLALCVGGSLTAFAVLKSFKGQSILTRRESLILLSTSFLPPLFLFATRLRPLELTVFDVRHLIPSMFPFLMLIAVGLLEVVNSLSAKRVLALIAGIAVLFGLQISALWGSWNKLRQPYSIVAAALKYAHGRAQAAYTTWPYGIGAAVNYYLGSDAVQPLRSIDTDSAALPQRFAILYRPGIPSEQSEVSTLRDSLPGASFSCEYYAAPASPEYGTYLCFVSRPSNTKNDPSAR